MDIKRPPRWKRLLKTVSLSLAAGLGILAVIGFIVQRQRDASFRVQHPPPGSFATVDGHRMHYRLSGTGEVTFVLEGGLGDYSGSWGALENELGKIGRVFVYDRAGLGWSDASREPRTCVEIARELHQLLAQAHVPVPYILVGHSLGGVSQYRFAMDYPDGVAGMLVIDPSHKDQFKRIAPPVIFTWIAPLVARTAPVGFFQLLFGSSDPVQNLTRHVETSGAELRAFLRINDTWGNRPLRIGNIPICVLTAGDWHGQLGKTDAEKKAAWETWKSMHAELVAGSTSAIAKQQVIEGASHYIQRTHEATVLAAAKELTDRVHSAKK